MGEFSRELIESLPQLVGQLSPASRAVVMLFYLHELSLAETAAVRVSSAAKEISDWLLSAR